MFVTTFLRRNGWKKRGSRRKSTHESSAEDKILRLGSAAIVGADKPTSKLGIKVAANNNRVKGNILLDMEDFVDVVKIRPQVLISWIVGLPVPGLPYLRPRELVLGDLGVDSGTRVAVPPPCASGVVTCLEDDSLQALVAEGLEHENASWTI